MTIDCMNHIQCDEHHGNVQIMLTLEQSVVRRCLQQRSTDPQIMKTNTILYPVAYKSHLFAQLTMLDGRWSCESCNIMAFLQLHQEPLCPVHE